MAAAAPTAVPPPQPRSSRWPSRYPLRRFPAEAVVVLAGYSLAVTSHTSHSGVRIGTWRRLTTDRDVFPRIFHSQKPRIRTKFVQNPWEGGASRGKAARAVGRRREPWEGGASRGKAARAVGRRREPWQVRGAGQDRRPCRSLHLIQDRPPPSLLTTNCAYASDLG